MATDLDVEDTPIGDIFPYPNNPRVNQGAIQAVAKSIKEFGFRQPIVVDRDGVIVAGHTRYLAALELGLETVPVHWARNLTPAQAQAYRIADNKTHELAEWDWSKLSLELKSLQDAGATEAQMGALGFSAEELQQALAGTMGSGGPEKAPAGSLSESFGVAPFSVLNAREGWWQARKDAWISLGIQSELGRGDNSAPGGSPRPLDRAKIARERKNPNATPGGSPLPAADYSTKARGDGRGRAMPK